VGFSKGHSRSCKLQKAISNVAKNATVATPHYPVLPAGHDLLTLSPTRAYPKREPVHRLQQASCNFCSDCARSVQAMVSRTISRLQANSRNAMISFLMAVATVTPVLVLMAFAVWGRPISALELISLAGSVCLGVGAFISLYKGRAARLLVLASALTQWIYLAPALRAAASNVSRGGSYPLQAFIPAIFARSRNQWRDSRASRASIARSVGVAGEYNSEHGLRTNNQRPDVTQRVWICMDCGADTKPFETEAAGESEQISEGSGDGKPDQ
jgi:hypothetical protein